MSDLIERETVLAFVRRCKDRLQGKGLTYDILVDYIESIPSAERKGEWIDKAVSIIDDMQREGIVDYQQAWEFRMRVKIKGAEDEQTD